MRPEYFCMDVEWFLDRLGQPRPCDLCGALTPPEHLTERMVPVAVADFGPAIDLRFTVQGARWVCPRCPLP
jgi:hypothetical protein